MKDFFENNCDTVRDLLPLYADGGCSEKTVRLIRKHLDLCPECRKYLKGIKKMRQKETCEDIPDSAPDYKALRKRIKQRRIIFTSVFSSTLLLLIAGDIIYLLTNEK